MRTFRASRLLSSSPGVLLLVSLGLTAYAAVDAHRTARSQRETADRAMREFASFAAWSYNERLETRLNAMLREALGAVNHGEGVHEQPPVPSARHLAHYLPFDSRCNCHRTYFGPAPVGAFAFELGDRGDDLELAENLDGDRHFAWEFDRAHQRLLPLGEAAPAVRPAEYKAWIVDTITRATRSTPRPSQGFTLVVGPNTHGAIAFTLMPTAWGDTMVYGFEYPRKEIANLLADMLDDPGLLPATFTGGQPNRDVVGVRVSTPGDAAGPIFVSAPGEASPHIARLEMAPQLGGLALDVFVHPDRANALVTGTRMPAPARLPILLGVLALAAALSVVAVVQLRRESAIARMRSDFVANVSHELRTPLAQIRLFTDTLRAGRATTREQQDWSLGNIERETTRLTSLVDNVLVFESGRRNGAGRASPPLMHDFAAQVTRIVDDFRPLVASRNVTVRVVVGESPPVLLDPDALKRVLLNYLDNAVKYGPPGQDIVVEVTTNGSDAIVSVTDQGPGVPAAERESIWEPFTRGRAATRAAGSGIGLSVVQQIAGHFNARAYVESTTQGARFVFAIPRAPAGAASPA